MTVRCQLDTAEVATAATFILAAKTRSFEASVLAKVQLREP